MAQRRSFLGAVGAGVWIAKPETVFGSKANSTVEIGLVGCGNRGNWIARFFPEYAGAKVVALADVQKTNLLSTAAALNVDAVRAYHGPDASKQLAASRLDAVVIETPTIFHPEIAEAAVEAGRHVYMAKPVAVDVPGCRRVLASGRKAAGKNLSYWVDFQTRAREPFQECARRVHRGDVGAPALAQVFYNAGRPWKDKGQPGMDPGHRRLANWLGDRVLSGDIIVEQNIHVLDVANWLLGAHPVKAHGTGGRADWSGTASDYGDSWDHFAVTYWYPNGAHASFSSHQLNGALADLCVRVYGIHGCADTHYNGVVRIVGKNAWVGTEKDETMRGGTAENVRQFVAAIREGKPIHNFETSVESNLTGILGRTAAYQGGEVTWDGMMQSTDEWTADLALNW